MPRRPPRLSRFAYRGPFAYFLTACTWHRSAFFRDAAVADAVRSQLLQTAAVEGFAVDAYCLMPDHVHRLAEGKAAGADARRFMNRWRQATGYAWRRPRAEPLWQEGYWDWVLRPDEDPLRVAAYIVHNPVRAGLARTVTEYRWVGSSRYTLEQLATAIQLRPGRRG